MTPLVQPFQLGSTFRSLGGASPHNLRPSMPVAPRAQPSTQSDGTTTASRTLSTNPEALVNLSGLQRQAAAAMCAAAVTAALVFTPVAMAKIDNSAVGSCVLQKCQTALAQCLGDVKCVENLVCLQVCNGADDETACQIKCGDKYADKAIDAFNTCAVSEKKCVPQRVDEGLYPIPSDCALDKEFDLSSFQGRWYITAGLNPLFDAFPCQEHYFASPESGKVFGKINWRIPQDNGDFMERSTMQSFVQDPNNPAILYNHGNEYLHYEDDWYIIGSKSDEYVFIYYRGQNDAWKGYGGATVYTRSASLPPALIPELKEKAEAAGLKWEDFILTDNSCKPRPAKKGLVQEIEQEVEEVEERYAAPALKSFGRGFTVLEKEAESLLTGVEAEFAAEEKTVADEASRLIRRFEMEAKMGGWVKAIPLSIRELIMPVS